MISDAHWTVRRNAITVFDGGFGAKDKTSKELFAQSFVECRRVILLLFAFWNSSHVVVWFANCGMQAALCGRILTKGSQCRFSLR